MSETDQEKTEQPSARRLEKSREQGQIPRSKELTSALLLLVASLCLWLAAKPAGDLLGQIMVHNFSLERSNVFDTSTMQRQLVDTATVVSPLIALVLAGLLLAGAVGQLLVGGWLFSGGNLAPKLSRMNPAQWIKKVFSRKGAMELLKSILKILLVMSCLAWLLWRNYPLLLTLSRLPFQTALTTGLGILGSAMFAYAMTLVFISALDAPFQIWDHKQKLMMTRQEVKDEHKEMEGSPEVKQKIRQIQREMANQRMMQRVPEADVVIVNPTHYSVALKYDQDRASAPFVLAKGIDQTAMHIREIATGNDIQIVEAPLLTRAIYYSTRIDQEIPADLYLAVAQVLAYVFQLRQFQQGKMKDHPSLPELDVPDEYRNNQP